jgi:hypothetical protein
MKAFVTLGEERNKMIHNNFLSYNFEKTFEEIRVLYEDAVEFLNYLKTKFE